jgi:glyoxylase-like metal-dependent hydrolase (beta-lactamase superfamily II)
MQNGAITYEVVEGIHCVKSVYAANKPLWVHVLEGDYTLWVDTGIDVTPADVVLPCLKARAPQASRGPFVAIITHADVDHFGGINGLRAARSDVVVLAHAADKSWIESPETIMRERYEMHAADGLALSMERKRVLNQRGGGGGKIDLALTGGEEFDLGRGGLWRVLHTPGHSAGHVVLWCAHRRCAIIGDAALDWGVPDDTGKLIAPPPYYDADAYLHTVAVLEALDPTIMLTSHYGILQRDAIRQLLRNSREAVERLDAAVMAALGERPQGWGLAELCIRTGELAGHWEQALWPALADPISAHLLRGINAGEVVRTVQDGAALYQRTAGNAPARALLSRAS